jgi:hypothetical protein
MVRLAGKGMIFRLTIGIEDCENEIFKSISQYWKIRKYKKSFAKKPFSCSNFTFNMSKKNNTLDKKTKIFLIREKTPVNNPFFSSLIHSLLLKCFSNDKETSNIKNNFIRWFFVFCALVLNRLMGIWFDILINSQIFNYVQLYSCILIRIKLSCIHVKYFACIHYKYKIILEYMYS